MKDTRQPWFKDAKYGLFIHWGLYSILAGEYNGVKTDRIAEWIENHLDIPVEDYRRLAGRFNPSAFDADELVRRAKEDWGMRYIVITAKHHEGFAMYDSRASRFNVVQATPYGRDILMQLRRACDKYGMRLGVYYSQAQDWDDPDGYVQYRDNSRKDFQRYFDSKCVPQVRELLENYGPLSLIWFDTPMGITEAQSRKLVDLVKSIQPDCLLSGRTGNGMGDYMTCGDNALPRLPYDGDWELPATVNDTWGYNQFDHNWKSPDDILRTLLKVVSRGGNYLLNVGPTAEGVVPGACAQVLDEVGRYVRDTGEAIYATRAVGLYPFEVPGIEMTRKPHRLFIHVLSPKRRIELLNIGNHFVGAHLVRDHRPLSVRTYHTCEGDSMVEVDLPEALQAQKNYCVCLEMEEEAPVFEPIRD